MTPLRTVALVLAAVLVITAATPARAEAMEPNTMLLIASTGVGIIIVIAYLIAANVSDRKPAGASAAGLPIGGTPVDGVGVEATPVAGAPAGATQVAGTSYVATPPPAAPTAPAPAAP